MQNQSEINKILCYGLDVDFPGAADFSLAERAGCKFANQSAGVVGRTPACLFLG